MSPSLYERSFDPGQWRRREPRCPDGWSCDPGAPDGRRERRAAGPVGDLAAHGFQRLSDLPAGWGPHATLVARPRRRPALVWTRGRPRRAGRGRDEPRERATGVDPGDGAPE